MATESRKGLIGSLGTQTVGICCGGVGDRTWVWEQSVFLTTKPSQSFCPDFLFCLHQHHCNATRHLTLDSFKNIFLSVYNLLCQYAKTTFTDVFKKRQFYFLGQMTKCLRLLMNTIVTEYDLSPHTGAGLTLHCGVWAGDVGNTHQLSQQQAIPGPQHLHNPVTLLGLSKWAPLTRLQDSLLSLGCLAIMLSSSRRLFHSGLT